mmetsp:Transcript_140711/g.245080  ORF Transcript_140711/g.245080 Transcript_140711/m.245080 type:complete len:252 (+) Transcript_140711:498-1253(+)
MVGLDSHCHQLFVGSLVNIRCAYNGLADLLELDLVGIVCPQKCSVPALQEGNKSPIYPLCLLFIPFDWECSQHHRKHSLAALVLLGLQQASNGIAHSTVPIGVLAVGLDHRPQPVHRCWGVAGEDAPLRQTSGQTIACHLHHVWVLMIWAALLHEGLCNVWQVRRSSTSTVGLQEGGEGAEGQAGLKQTLVQQLRELRVKGRLPWVQECWGLLEERRKDVHRLAHHLFLCLDLFIHLLLIILIIAGPTLDA